jgi:hypothetical protein
MEVRKELTGTACSKNQRVHLEIAYAHFTERYPGYGGTVELDRLRATEYPRLDEFGQVHIDYTGGSLVAETQLEELMKLLCFGVFGNPHSSNPTSAAMTRHLESTRRSVLRCFNASADPTRLFETPHLGVLRIDAGHNVPDGAVPAGRIHPLKDHKQRIAFGGVVKALQRTQTAHVLL